MEKLTLHRAPAGQPVERVVLDGGDPLWHDEADVVVAGCGSGGAPAAIEAARGGADVFVFEKADWLGGCMRRSGGGLLGCDTLVQRRLGVEDPGPEQLLAYLSACAGPSGDLELLRVFAEHCGPDVDWVITPRDQGGLGGEPLGQWGFSTPEDRGMTAVVRPGLNVGGPIDEKRAYWHELGFPDDMERRRVHWFKPNPDDADPGDRHYARYKAGEFGAGFGSTGGGGTGLWKPFEDELRCLPNVRIQAKTSLAGLVTDAAGAVVEVAMEPAGVGEAPGLERGRLPGHSAGALQLVRALRGVIVATGSFVHDRSLYERTTGRSWRRAGLTNGSPYNDDRADGAGVRACLAVGVSPAFMEEGNSGGLRIDGRARALRADGRPVSGLYITSRAVGGLFSESRYPQCGSFISSCLCFGRIAGREAAARERRRAIPYG